jgi:hypothetical protein
MKDKQTIAQFLGLTITSGKPFVIKNDKGKEIYFEETTGFWWREEFDERGNVVYFENFYGDWKKHEYNEQGTHVLVESNYGIIMDNRPKPKIELTLQEIAEKLGIPVEQLRIKD